MGFPERKCPNCGKVFSPNWNTRKYCSDGCALEYQRWRRREARKFREEAR